MKKILVIDDSETIVERLFHLFNKEARDLWVVNKDMPINTKDQALTLIKQYEPEIILMDHELTKGGNEGLIVAEEIFRLNKEFKKSELYFQWNGMLVISTSIRVSSSGVLTEEYRKVGVRHFADKANFKEIMQCIDGNCGCYSPLISFLP